MLSSDSTKECPGSKTTCHGLDAEEMHTIASGRIILLSFLSIYNILGIRDFMFNSSLNNPQNNNGLRKQYGQETDATSSDLSSLGFAQEMMQVINSQHVLIAKLL